MSIQTGQTIDAGRRGLAHAAPVMLPPGAIGLALWVLVTAVVVTGLLLLAARAGAPPLIVNDNAYIFLAADRMFEGLGPTCTPPLAPFQPWTWRADWALITNWPVGYPVLICAVRTVFGGTSASAAVVINVVCCGVALVAWFAWVRRSLKASLSGTLVAFVAALSTFKVFNLLNPNSDTVVLAGVPVVLLIVGRGLAKARSFAPSGLVKQERVADHGFRDTLHRYTRGYSPAPLRGAKTAFGWLALGGLAAGALFWIRYAAIFLPAGVGMYLAWQALKRRIGLTHVAVFAVCAALPVGGLLALNAAYGVDTSVQEQLNLGSRFALNLDAALMATAWQRFTEQTIYAHRPEAAAVFGWIVPIAGVTTLLIMRRRGGRGAESQPANLHGYWLSAAVAAAMLVMLVIATACFSSKYHFVGLDRYYQPIRPLYWLLFLGPIIALRHKLPRIAVCITLLAAGSWYAKQDAGRAYGRAIASDRPATDYGRAVLRFEPGSRELFAWLKEQAAPNLVVFSNFHDDIALETGIAACPTPDDATEMVEWLERLKAARDVDTLRVLFVLDPDNRNRAYFLPPVDAVIDELGLVAAEEVPLGVSRYVWTPSTAADESEPRP